jgi:hypothetical protein
MSKCPTVLIVALVGLIFAALAAVADEEPISGTVKAIDTAANTLMLQTTAKGKTRDVTVHLRPQSKIVKFTRSTEPGKTGFVEQPLALTDLKPGWIVSVIAKHEGGNEVAEVVKVVLEK